MADHAQRLYIPALGGLYSPMGGIAYALLRVVAGLALVTHGFPKILDPFGASGMVEGLGFYPGAFWSPVLAITEFFGGILLAIGFLTRPVALAITFQMCVVIVFHWVVQGEGYSGAEKGILWAAITFFFLFSGGGPYSVDRAIGREF